MLYSRQEIYLNVLLAVKFWLLFDMEYILINDEALWKVPYGTHVWEVFCLCHRCTKCCLSDVEIESIPVLLLVYVQSDDVTFVADKQSGRRLYYCSRSPNMSDTLYTLSVLHYTLARVCCRMRHETVVWSVRAPHVTCMSQLLLMALIGLYWPIFKTREIDYGIFLQYYFRIRGYLFYI